MAGADGGVMIREAERLARDLREQREPIAASARAIVAAAGLAAIDRFHLVGNGDSAHAALAAEAAFDRVAAVPCEAAHARRFLDHGLGGLQRARRRTQAVVALSASGATPGMLDVVARARACGALTIGVTSTRDSELTRVTDACLVVDLPDRERSPGIRTHQASLLALVSLALALARPERAAPLDLQLRSLDAAVGATVGGMGEPCRAAAAIMATAPAILCLGSGPHYGTSRFVAAKLVEGAGVPAFAQDLEEWRHVERLADPRVLLIVFAPPGDTRDLAVTVARAAHASGRSVVVVAPEDAPDIATLSLPVRGTCDETLSPLLYSLCAPLLAAALGQILDRAPFHYR